MHASQVSAPSVKRPRKRHWHLLLAVGAIAILAAAVAATQGIGLNNGEQGGSAYTGLPPAIAQVTKGNLQQTQQVSGVLSHGEPVQLVTQAASGIVTWVAPEGSTIYLGDPVFKIDGKPVVLLHGELPMYRTLQEGVVGPDVLQLEKNLVKLGYTALTVDDIFDWQTANAVIAWQESLGQADPWQVTPDEVAVAPGTIRVALQAIQPGTALGGLNTPILTYSGVAKYVTAPLDVNKQHLVKLHQPVTVTLPDGGQVAGVVDFIDTVATTIDDKQAIAIHVAIEDQQALGTLEAAPVSVNIVTGEKKGVLTVPVNALVALADGGYGVQVVNGGVTTYVAVETGMFANGMVEVSGAGISDGTTIGVAS
jgi:peptidoglycan hydrolase-like protein with peptidoglycan-binding domain